MRNLLIHAFVLSILIGLMSCTATDRSVITEHAGQESEVRIYEVFGMDCPGCHGALEKLVEKIPAVQKAEANWKEKQLSVIVRPGTVLNDEDIYDAIRRANFTVGDRIQ
jgi:copper chaperone CopZ